MRIVIISDIHGNDLALEAVLADLKGETYDKIVCNGDAIQGGPQPKQVVTHLKELGCPVVIGNADMWMLTGVETGAEHYSDERKRRMDEVRLWSMEQLSEDDRQTIRSYQPTVRIPLGDGRDLLCFHGSPQDFDEIILPTTSEEAFNEMLARHVPHLMTGGHTHIQHLRRIGASDSIYFNPGSVGLAYSHNQPEGQSSIDTWAEYAVLTVDGGRYGLEFRRVPVDFKALFDVYRSSGRPHAEFAISQYRS
jgi:predicted phosphodiesterase